MCMETTIHLELGPMYQVTYANGTKIVFQIQGGPNLNVIINDEIGKMGLEGLLQNFISLVKISD